MRLSTIATAAGLVIATLGIGTAADAQPYGRGDQHDVRYDRDHGRGNGWGRDDNHGRGNGWGRDHARYGNGYGRGYGRQHCWIEYRHHHRVRVCR